MRRDAAVPTVVTQLMADDAATELEHEAEGFHEALAMLEAEAQLRPEDPRLLRLAAEILEHENL